MSLKKRTIRIAGFVLLLLGVMSCVKDVDFDQTDDVKLEPVYELDFVYARITTPKFTNPNTGSFVQVLRDTLQDDFFSGDVGGKLLKAELFVSLENSIPVGFDAELKFLDGNNVVIPITTSPIIISIPSGGIGNLQSSERTYAITLADLKKLESAKKIASFVTIDGNDNDLGGELILKSKGIYYTSLLDE